MIVLLLLDNDSSKLEEINNSLLHINNGKGVISVLELVLQDM